MLSLKAVKYLKLFIGGAYLTDTYIKKRPLWPKSPNVHIIVAFYAMICYRCVLLMLQKESEKKNQIETMQMILLFGGMFCYVLFEVILFSLQATEEQFSASYPNVRTVAVRKVMKKKTFFWWIFLLLVFFF